jgi:hypothetical protein
LSKGGSSNPGISLFNFTQKTVCAIRSFTQGLSTFKITTTGFGNSRSAFAEARSPTAEGRESQNYFF